jgi:hypothetical protein
MALKWWQRKVNRASKPRPRRQRRLCIEALEARCTPSISAGLSGRVLLVTCDNSGNSVSLVHDVSGARTAVNGQFFADSSFDTIQINNGAGADVDTVFSSPAKPLNIRGGGFNTVNLGSSSTGGLRSLLGPVNVTNPPAFTALNLNDHGGSSNGFTGTLSVNGGVGTISFSGAGHPATITYNISDVRPLNIDGLGDTFNVQSTAGGIPVNIQDAALVNLGNNSNGVQSLFGPVTVTEPFVSGANTSLLVQDQPDSGGRTVTLGTSGSNWTIVGLAPATIAYNMGFNVNTLFIGAGQANDVFNVLSTPPFTTTDFDSSRGADTINVGNSSNGMQSILGPLYVQNIPSFTTLNLNDSADTTAQTVTLSTNGSLGFVTGLGTPVQIQYAVTDLSALNILTGRAAATVNVQGTGNVPVRLDSGGGTDAVLVGNSTNGLQSIHGPLDVHNGPAFSTLSLLDSADTTARTINMSVTGSTGTVNGLAPWPITYATGDITALSLVTGQGGASVNVASTAAATAVSLFGNGTGAGATVYLGNSTSGVQGIQGAVSVFNAYLVVDDSADPTSRIFVMRVSGTTGTIAGAAPALISYSTNVSGVTLDGGSGGNYFYVFDTPMGINTYLFTGSGNDTVNVGNPNTLDGSRGSSMSMARPGSTGSTSTTRGAPGTPSWSTETMCSVPVRRRSSSRIWECLSAPAARALVPVPNPPWRWRAPTCERPSKSTPARAPPSGWATPAIRWTICKGR